MRNHFPGRMVVLAAAVAAAGHFGSFRTFGDDLDYSGGAYTQDFNSLWTNGATPPQNLEPGTPPVQIGPTLVGSAPIDLTGPSQDLFGTIPQISTMTGWWATSFGGNSVALKYNVNDGSSSTEALTAYYDPARQSAGNNLALGALTSSTTGNVVFGVRLLNTGTTALNAISLSYTGQLFHEDTGSKTLTFGYSVDPTAAASLPISGTTGYSALNVGGFATGAAGAVAASPSSSEALSVVNLPLSTPWAPGQALWLTWTMNTAGGGQGLAIDNLAFSAASITGAPTLIWNLAGGGNWNATDANWSGSATTFANGAYNVSFGNIAGNAAINVDAGGVSVPGSVTVTNNGPGMYVFAGGSIGGSASLNINGTGSVELTAANSYGGGTNLNAGTLIVDNNNELGNASASLNFMGGALKLADSLAGGSLDTGSRPLSVSAAGGMIDTNGSALTFDNAGAAVIHGMLEAGGGGNLTLVQPTFGSLASPDGGLIVDAGTTVTLVGNGRSSPSDMYSGGIINGTLVLDSPAAGARFNFDSPGVSGSVDHNGDSKITGTGQIEVVDGSGWTDTGSGTAHKWQLDTNGTVISNTSATYAAEIDVGLYLNPLADSDPANRPYQRMNVATANFISASSPNAAVSFVTIIGGTKIGTQGHGPGFSNLKIGGVISGHSDISFGNDYKGGGSGDVTLLAQNTYDGDTMINGGGALYLGVTDALPPTTDVVFGSVSGAGAGSIDLSGHDQHINSLEVGIGTNAPQLNVIDNSGASNATLYITGNVTPFYPYNAQLNDGGVAADGTTGTRTLALNKSGTGTLILGEYLAAGHSTTSSYSGGTTISGGILQIAFDGALGAPAGSLTLDGGTLAVENPFFQGTTGSETVAALASDRPFAVTDNGGTLSVPAFQATLQDGTIVPAMIESVTFSGNGGYNWESTAVHPLVIDGPAGSAVTLNGGSGSVSVSAGATIQLNATAMLAAGGNSDPFTDSVDPTQHVAIANAGDFSITAGDKSVAAITGTGSTSVAAGAGLWANSITQAAGLTVNGNVYINATVVAAGPGLRNAGASTSVVGELIIAGGATPTGTLNLNNNALIISNGGAAERDVATAQVANARNGGHWNQPGITSSNAQATFASTGIDSTTLGVVLNSDLPTPYTSFNGNPVGASDVLIKYTYGGDANLDGSINGNDYFQIDRGFLNHYTGWVNGDFNYDGTVNGNDYFIIDSNFINQSGKLAASEVLAHAAEFGPSYLSEFSSSQLAAIGVPEPTSLALLGLGACGFLLRRKREI